MLLLRFTTMNAQNIKTPIWADPNLTGKQFQSPANTYIEN